MIQSHGKFKAYTPNVADYPEDAIVHRWIKIGVLFICNEQGVDWYEIAHAGPTGKTFASLHDDGRVASVGTDPERMFPADLEVIETDQPVEMGWYRVGDEFKPLEKSPREVPNSQGGAPVDV